MKKTPLIFGIFLSTAAMADNCPQSFAKLFPLSNHFFTMSAEYQHYVYKVKSTLPTPVAAEVYMGKEVHIPQGMTRDNAAFSAFVSNEIVLDLKSRDSEKMLRALHAIPDYLNNAFSYPNPNGPGLAIYDADILKKELKSIVDENRNQQAVEIAKTILNRS